MMKRRQQQGRSGKNLVRHRKTFESLEHRHLMAVDFVAGTLHVTGRDTDDVFRIQSVEANPASLEVFVNGVREYVGATTDITGGIQVNGLAGNDQLNVDMERGDSIPLGGIFFQGGIPEGGGSTGDRLNILPGNRLVEFQGESTDLDAGLFRIGSSAPLSFDGVEALSLNGTDYLRPDRFERNDGVSTATILGDGTSTIERRLTIHPMGRSTSNGDFFKITAGQTGVMLVNTWFDHEAGNLNVNIRDRRGTVIATASSTTDNEVIAFSVVTEEEYFVEVFGVNGATNQYDLEVQNIPVVAPQSVVLDPASDSGMMNNDRVTRDVTPRFLIQADVTALRNLGIPILGASQAANGGNSGAAIAVQVVNLETNRTDIYFADPIEGQASLFEVTLPALNSSRYTISAGVRIIDMTTVAAGVDDSPFSAALPFVIDAVSPSIETPLLIPSSDSGMSDLDMVTNIMQPAFVGTAEPNSKVRILANGLIVGTGTAASDGRWEITVEPLDEGIHFITAEAEDVAGNFGESPGTKIFEIDKSAPNTPYLDLVDGSDTGSHTTDNVTGDNTLTFTMTTTDANDADHLEEFNLKFRLYVRPEGGAERLIYDSAVDPFIPAANMQGGFTNLTLLTKTLESLPAGSHHFKLEVEDRAGNISEDFLLPVEIDNDLLPEDNLRLSPSSDSGMFNNDLVTHFSRPSFVGTGEVGALVTLLMEGNVIGTGRVGADASDGINGNGIGAWEITTGALRDGIYTVTALLQDGAGNQRTSPPVTVEIDTFQPNTPLLDLLPISDSGHSSTDNITSATRPTFNLITADPNAESHLSPFNYKYRLYRRQEAGVETLLYDSSTDTSIPASAFSNGFTSLENLRREIALAVPDGTHNLKLEVEDRAGNISQDFLLNLQLDTSLLGTAEIDLANASDTGMMLRDNVTRISRPTLTGSDEIGAIVSIYADSVLVGSGTVGTDESDGVLGNGLGAWQVITNPLTDGQHNLVVQIEDWAGNVRRSAPLAIEIDTRAPNTPNLDLALISDTGISGSDNLTNRTNLIFDLSSSDPTMGQHQSEFNLKYRLYLRPAGGGETLVYDSSNDPSIPADNLLDRLTNLNTVRTTLTNLPAGTHNFKLEVEDRAGNISAHTLLNVTIDPTLQDGATIQLSPHSDTGMSNTDGVTNLTRPTWTGVGDVGSRVTLVVDGRPIGTGTVGGDASNGVLGDGLGLWEVASEPLADGIYEVRASFEDSAGNITTTVEMSRVEIDVLSPNQPYLDLLDATDTGHGASDNITRATNLRFNMASQDPNQNRHISLFNYKFRLYTRLEGGAEELVYNSVGDSTLGTSSDGVFTNLEELQRTITRVFPDGTHNFKLEVEDRAGNISLPFLLNVTVDTVLRTEPLQGVVADMLSSSDTGMDSRDNTTKINRPVFGGVAEVGAEVSLYADGRLAGTATVGSDDSDLSPGDGLGAWQIVSGTLTDGTHDMLVQVEDWAGNLVSSAEQRINIDTEAPNTPLLDLVGGNDSGLSGVDEVTNLSTLMLTMTSEDPAIEQRLTPFNYKFRIFRRTEGNAEELVYNSVNDPSIPAGNTAAGFTDLTFLKTTLANLADGVHNLKLEVEDRAGNISHDFLLNLRVDTTLQGTPNIDLIASSDTGMFNNDNVTNKDQLAFHGTGEVGSTVRLRANDRIVGTGIVGSDLSDGIEGNGLGEWEITSEPLADGVHIVTAELEDLAGNSERTGQLSIEVDTLPSNTPVLDLVPTADSGLSGTDNVTRDNTPNFSMATSDPNQAAHLSPFNYKFRIYARLESGAEQLVYNSVTDTNFPASAFRDGFSSLENLRRELATSLPDGTHNFKLEIEDRAGNISDDFLLDVTIDTTLRAPNNLVGIDLLASSDTGMSATDNVTSIQSPALKGIAEVGAMVTIFANGDIVGTGKVGSDETDGVPGNGLGAWEVTVEPMADGVYSFSAHVEDLAGNFRVSDGLNVEIDTKVPNTPLLDLVTTSDSGIGGGDEVTQDNTPTFNMTTTDPNQANHLFDHNFKFRLYARLENTAERLVYDSSSDTSIPVANLLNGLTDLDFLQRTLATLPDGRHNFKLEVEDRAGNISEDFLLNLVVDTNLVTPTIDLIASSDTGMSETDNVTNKDQLAFAGVGEVGDRVNLYANGVLVGTGFVGSDLTDNVPGNRQGAWEITTEPLDDGVYTITALVEDQAGNNKTTATTTVEVDTIVPNTPHLNLADESDSGLGQSDNVTRDNTPTIDFTTTDLNQDLHLFPENYKYRLYIRPEGIAEVLLYDSTQDASLQKVDGLTSREFIRQILSQLPDGDHNLKLEVEDRAGNISPDVTLNLTIDTGVPTAIPISLAASSDTGMSNSDRVTNKDQLAIVGTASPGTVVRVFANGVLVGTGTVGSEESDGAGGGAGLWEVTTEPLVDGVHTLTATFEDLAGNIGNSTTLTVAVDTLAPNTPFLDLRESDDTGRHNDDNVTNAATLNFTATSEDAGNLDLTSLIPGGQNFKYRLYDRPEAGIETLIYNSVGDTSLANKLDGLTASRLINIPAGSLAEGIHNLKLEVEDRAGNISTDFLQNVLVDRTPFAGTGRFHPDSDTGIWGIDSTFGDNITGDSTPAFVGEAEANNIVTVVIDGVGVGTAVALPFDGDDGLQPPQAPYAGIVGNWNLNSSVSLVSGRHTVSFVFEDVAGNRATVNQALAISIDTSGPRIENVTRADLGFTSLFDPKPAGGPDPLISSVVVHFADGPGRFAEVPYGAVLSELALEEGNYRVVGDANGNMAITNVEILSEDKDGPGVARTSVKLTFASPLPDDRFTITVFDRIADAAGNPLDGESGANGPFEGNDGLTTTPPIFPTGDGNHGADFQARFTIDSRPEIGVWAAGSIWVDTNGNFVFDPTNSDFVNRDITYAMGFTSDDIFAGNFANAGGTSTDGYDKLAAYGRANGAFRWLIDTNNDGVADIHRVDPQGANGVPVAGNFDGNRTNGDEVAVYTGSTWHIDTNHDFLVDRQVSSNLRGYPIVGDFDGNGTDDLATWADDEFMVDLAGGTAGGWDGQADVRFRFGFIGVRERPVAADMDQDGFDDLGLWVPDREGVTLGEASEWYWLVSGGNSVLSRSTPALDPVRGAPVVNFRPIPFGKDIFAQFGDEFALPIVGNFDPPILPAASIAATTAVRHTNPFEPLDVNGDGSVTARDALVVINYINRQGSGPSSEIPAGSAYVDVNDDQFVTPRDVLAIIKALNGLRPSDPATASSVKAAPPTAGSKFDTSLGPAIDIMAADIATALLRQQDVLVPGKVRRPVT